MPQLPIASSPVCLYVRTDRHIKMEAHQLPAALSAAADIVQLLIQETGQGAMNPLDSICDKVE